MRDFMTRLRSSLKPQNTTRVLTTGLTGPSTAENVRDGPLIGGRLPPVGILPGRGRRLRSQLYGAAVLLLTTVLWASGGPTTKYLFLLPAPPSAALLTACISVITALFLGVGLMGASMESGGGGRHSRAAVSDPEAAAAAAAAERKPSGADMDADEAEAEALLHSGMHTTGAAGGALVAACAAAREAAQERERERVLWARAQECALPLLPSHGSYFYSSLTNHSRADPADTELGKSSATVASEAGLIGDDRGSMGGEAGVYSRRGPSLDGTVAGPSATSSPSPQLQRSRIGTDQMPREGPDVNVWPRRRSTEGGGSGPGPGRWRLRLLTAPAYGLPAAGLELGIYNVTAAALGAWGMQRISATRSAFLAQATSLLTPLLVWLSGGRVGLVVWTACLFGAVGGAMVALDNAYGAAAAAATAAGSAASPGGGQVRHVRQLLVLLNNIPGLIASSNGSSISSPVAAAETASGLLNDRTALSAEVAVAAAAPAAVTDGRWQVEGALLSRQAMGAAYVLMSCVFWGLGTVRLGVHSARYRPLQLAAAAAMCYAGLSLLWLFAEIVGSPSAGLSDFLELGLLLRNHVTAALLLWAGLGPGALSSYLQVLGQQTVPPAQAQVLFSSTPLWSAVIAQLLLPGEAMGPLAWFGGAVMLGASLLASLWQ